jgi:WD40 repeat protein
MPEGLAYRASMKAHTDCVTAISINSVLDTEYMIVSGSRDKTVLVWKLLPQEETFGGPCKTLLGHTDCVQVLIGIDVMYLLL